MTNEIMKAGVYVYNKMAEYYPELCRELGSQEEKVIVINRSNSIDFQEYTDEVKCILLDNVGITEISIHSDNGSQYWIGADEILSAYDNLGKDSGWVWAIFVDGRVFIPDNVSPTLEYAEVVFGLTKHPKLQSLKEWGIKEYKFSTNLMIHILRMYNTSNPSLDWVCKIGHLIHLLTGVDKNRIYYSHNEFRVHMEDTKHFNRHNELSEMIQKEMKDD